MKDLITVKHAASLFSLKREHINNYLHSGKVEGILVGSTGHPRATSLHGRLVYHNLVSVESLANYLLSRSRSEGAREFVSKVKLLAA